MDDYTFLETSVDGLLDLMFGDFKKHGSDLERTMLRRFLRLPRPTLAMA